MNNLQNIVTYLDSMLILTVPDAFMQEKLPAMLMRLKPVGIPGNISCIRDYLLIYKHITSEVVDHIIFTYAIQLLSEI